MARQSKGDFIAWLWAQQSDIVALAQDMARNTEDGYDIAMDALTDTAAQYGAVGRAPNRGDVLQALRSRVRSLCTQYRAQRTRMTTKRDGGNRRDTVHSTAGLRRVQGSDADSAALRVASDATIWEQMSTQYLPVYTREGPGPCNLCGRTVWWTALNWGARNGGARWMRKWEVIGARTPDGRPASYDAMRPSGQRHICGVMDKSRKPRYAVLMLPRRAFAGKSQLAAYQYAAQVGTEKS